MHRECADDVRLSFIAFKSKHLDRIELNRWTTSSSIGTDFVSNVHVERSKLPWKE